LAGCAFLIGPDIVLTCAHVIGAHLGLPSPVPAEAPGEQITIRFEALQDEVTGHVLRGGWFPNIRAARGELSDIAVVCLDKPVAAIEPLPKIGERMPAERRPVLVHGAEADYKSYGQQVQGEIGGSNIPRGWRQIDPKDSLRGFTVESGFSGSPVLDDLGNVVWGMIVAVAKGTGVAYAIPADSLWTALRSAGAETTVRLADKTDQSAAKAMARLREEYEARLAEREAETDRMRRELDRLRGAVRGIEQEARQPTDQQAGTALEALAEGVMLPATAVLRQRLEERLAAAGDARREVAAAARQLGEMLKLVDSAAALRAFRQAADADSADFWTWIEIARLEQDAGTLAGARTAIDSALSLEAADERSASVALNDLGNVQQAQGDLAAALTSYQASLAIAERLAKADPGNASWQGDLSVSYEKIGDVQQAQGDLAAALTSYQVALAIRERLAKADPGNAGWQRDLSVSHNKVGDVQQAQGDLAALTSYQAGLAIIERLAKADPGNAGWQYDLGISNERIGDVMVAQGNLADALGAYQAKFSIIDRLAKADPGNAGWQRDLSVSYEKIGDVQRAGGGAHQLPGFARDCRATGQGGPRQRRLAARPLGLI
jgi:tetratricopeptide (TPR) repeat protein